MTAKAIAWVSSVLLGITLLISVGGFSFLLSGQREVIQLFRVDELNMTSVQLSALERVEAGEIPQANDLMIERVFVGLTRLEPYREQLREPQQARFDELVRRLSAYRQRNPAYFLAKPEWWTGRLDGWVSVRSVFNAAARR